MSNSHLDPDLAEAARRLNVTCRVSARDNPALYRTILRGRRQLVEYFGGEIGWHLEIQEVAGLVRLHKRRDDVPADRGPYLIRSERQGQLAGPAVLVIVALVCEQLWRRPRMTLRELLQSVAQVCAAEALSGRLPAFRIVATDGVSKQEAHQHRRNIVDALKLLLAEGEISVDSDLERAVGDEEADLFITADRESLATKFASLSPTLLALSTRPAESHAVALSANSLSNADPEIAREQAGTVEGRRLAALRRVVDDPAVDPFEDPSAQSGSQGYLSTAPGRERALNAAAALGLVATVRRDWWEVTEPSGSGSGIDFPQGRRSERQAALALLRELVRRDDPTTPLTCAEVVSHFLSVRESLPRWAASYDNRLNLLARAAAGELVAVGLLRQTADRDSWQPTPGIHLWRVRVRLPIAPPVAPTHQEAKTSLRQETVLLDDDSKSPAQDSETDEVLRINRSGEHSQ